MVSTALISKVR